MHLVVRSDEYYWVNNVPQDMWTYGHPDKFSRLRLESVSKMFSCDLPAFVPEQYRCSMNAVLSGSISYPWRHILPRSLYKQNLGTIINALKQLYDAFSDSGYMETCFRTEAFLGLLERVPVNSEKLSMHLENENSPTVKSTLRSFSPSADGLCKPVSYDHYSTSTGRMTVKSGPRILTLPARCRDILESKDPEKILIQVDFISLEPRVALCVRGLGDNSADIYDLISKNLFSGKFTRSQMKIAVLCALYGVSAKKLSKIIPGNDSHTVIREVKKYFGVFEKTATLKALIEKNGFLQNAFGRPLFFDDNDDHLLFSHFIQSTAASAAVLGFIGLNSEMSNVDINFKQFFVIHDACIVEIKKSDIAQVEKICSSGIKIEGLGVFPLSVKVLDANGI